MSLSHDECFPEFEKLGEAEVRRLLICHELHIMKQDPARAWLTLREAEARTRSEEREAKTLALTQAANNIASKARSDARIANIIAIIAVVIAVISILVSKFN